MIRTRLQGDTPFFPNMLNNGKVEVCLKEDVDKTLAEKDKEIAELKKKLEDVNELVKESKELLKESQKMHQRCADNASKQIRRLKRVLWVARALRARDKAFEYHFKNNVEMCAKWDNVHLMLMAKAEEYK